MSQHGLCSQTAWVLIWALLLTSCSGNTTSLCLAFLTWKVYNLVRLIICMYWGGQKVCWGFPKQSSEKTQVDIWPTQYMCACVMSRSVVSNSVTPWTVVYQAPLPMRFPRQEYCSELSFPTPGDLPDSGMEPVSLASLPLAGGLFTTIPPRKPP